DGAAERLMALRPSGATTAPVMAHVGAARARAAYLASAPGALTTSPVAGRISSSYGARIDPISGHEAHHHGLDIAAPEGAPVRAAGAGTVVRAGEESGYGNVVVVDHGAGIETRYAHLAAIHVRPGQRLDAGVELGLVGSTGKSTGPHLHFEVRRDGRSIDPAHALRSLR
ncbi:M23 family metallopeptidase, partial [Myxococcota bacterium]|nr:M23 family metallopeptidase [Myxococcota bacterium]